MKIVINTSYGCFSVSEEVYNKLGLTWDNPSYLSNDHFNIDSTNPHAYRAAPELVEAVEKLGKAANTSFSSLKVVEIPDGVKWEIDEGCGCEKIVKLVEFGIKELKAPIKKCDHL